MFGDIIICKRCGIQVQKKLKAKTPKYCPTCRRVLQDEWRNKIKNARQERMKNRPIEPVGGFKEI